MASLNKNIRLNIDKMGRGNYTEEIIICSHQEFTSLFAKDGK